MKIIHHFLCKSFTGQIIANIKNDTWLSLVYYLEFDNAILLKSDMTFVALQALGCNGFMGKCKTKIQN